MYKLELLTFQYSCVFRRFKWFLDIENWSCGSGVDYFFCLYANGIGFIKCSYTSLRIWAVTNNSSYK